MQLARPHMDHRTTVTDRSQELHGRYITALVAVEKSNDPAKVLVWLRTTPLVPGEAREGWGRPSLRSKSQAVADGYFPPTPDTSD